MLFLGQDTRYKLSSVTHSAGCRRDGGSRPEEIKPPNKPREKTVKKIERNKKSDAELLRSIAEGTASVTGADFFRSLVRNLASSLQVRYAFVAECTDRSKTRVRTLQFWSGEDFGGDFEYDVHGTPCEKVLDGTVCYHSQDVQALFPKDRDLVKLKAESYLGIPLVDNSDEIIGHLAVLDDKPMGQELGERAMLLKIFAARASAELERKRAEERLEESEARFRTLVEHAPEGILVFDADVNLFIDANRNAALILGYPKKQLLKMSWIDMSAPTQSGSRPAFEVGRTLNQEALSGGVPVFEWTFIRASGEEIIADVRLVRLPKTERNLLRASITDITERKRAEEALVSSQARFSAVVDTVGEGIITIDSKSTIVMVNQEVQNIWGYRQEELAGKKLHILMPEKYRGLHSSGMERYLKTGVAQVLGKRLELEGLKKDGSTFPLGIRIKETRIEEHIFFTAAVRDITERKQAEAALRYRGDLENLITDISTRFINLPPTSSDDGINDALRRIGEFVGADRSYVFLSFDNLKTASDTHEWCAEGIPSARHELQNLPTELFPWFMRFLYRGEALHIPSVADLPPEARLEKEMIQRQQVQSLVCVPMAYQDSLIGLVGFDSVRQARSWSEDVVKLLKIVGEIFANALRHKWDQEALQRANEDLEKKVDERTRELRQKQTQLVQSRCCINRVAVSACL